MRPLLPALLLGLLAPGRAEAQEHTRWVLAVGSHVGDAGTDKLRHASSDALSFVDVLTQLGSVDRERVIFLDDPTVDDLRAQLVRLRGLLADARDAGERPDVLFYYSGHSDERGLTPYGALLPWGELRTSLGLLDAELRVGIFDSCASGAFIRRKGGKPTTGFLQDQFNVVTGEAFIMSASADESAQESDRLGGSYFTHHFVSGLRGAADDNGDRVVTLDEAYTYAYQQTVRGTEQSWVGAQHPYYDMDVSGRGDVVLTDLREHTALLVFDEALDGQITVRDDEGRMVTELDKRIGSAMSYSLAPGRYNLRLWTREDTFKARVTVDKDGRTAVTSGLFEPIASLERTRLRGPRPPTWTRTHPMSAHLFPVAGSYGLATDIRTVGFSLNVLGAIHPEHRGAQIGSWSVTTGDLVGADMEGLVSYVRGEVKGWQLSGLGNSAGSLRGVQMATVNHVAGDAGGWQGGVVNWVEGRFDGVQVGGLFNVVRGHSPEGQRGVQMAGLYNRAAAGFKGAQLAFINDADRIRGAQLGVFNVAKDMEGFQLGLVNISKRSTSEALGFLTIHQDGYHAVEVATDEQLPILISVKTGSKVLYNRFRFGLDPQRTPLGFEVSWGLGGHVQKQRFVFDGDLNVVLPQRTIQYLAGNGGAPGGDIRLDTTFGIEFVRGFDLFVGPTMGIAMNFDNTPLDLAGDDALFVPSWDITGIHGPEARIWVGYTAGLRARF